MSTPSKPQQNEKKHRSLSKTLTYIGTVVLLIVVVIAFVGTPAVGGIAGGTRMSFGSYAGREIIYEPGNFLARQYQDIAQRVQQQEQQVTDMLIRQVWRTAFQRAVYHEAMMLLGEEAGVSVSARAVDRAIAQWPAFQVNGRFSSEEFNATSNQERFALRQYLREVLIDTQVQTDLYGETPASAAEQEFIVNMAGPERQFRFVQFSFADYPEAEVVDYGQANRERFQRINLSVITITSNESEAESIREQAVSRQTSFEDLARNQSTDTYSEDGGEMGWVYYHELEPDFEDTDVIDEIFALEEGEISRVCETTFGWTIYRVNEPPIDPDFTDDDVIAAIRDYLTVFERGLIEDYLNARADEFVADAAETGFEAAASRIDQSPLETGYFPINYGNVPYFGTVNAPANQTLGAAAFREDFFEELFALEGDDVSEPVVVRDYVFVFQLANEREASADVAERLESNMDVVIREFTREQVQSTLVDDDKLVDNFNSTFNRVILGQ